MLSKKWTEVEDSLLKTVWQNESQEKILSLFPNRTWTALQQRAAKFKIKRLYNPNKTCDLSFLDLNNLTPNSCYWWGFIMADGYLGKTNLAVKLQESDKPHLEKLSKLLGNCNIHNVTSTNFNKISKLVYINIADKNFINSLKSQLKIIDSKTKTYFPPDLSIFMTKENLIYFLIGFIDGDGTISVRDRGYYDVSIKIECHENWTDTFLIISKKLKGFYNITSHGGKSGKKRVRGGLWMYTKNDIKYFWEKSKKVDFLNRKWGKLNIVYDEKNI